MSSFFRTSYKWFVLALGLVGLLLPIRQAWASYANSTSPQPLANPGVDCQPVSFTDNPDPVAETGTVTYTILMKNNSAIAGDNVTGGQLTVTVPNGFTYLSNTTDHGTCSYSGPTPSDGTGQLQCTGVNLQPLDVATVTMDIQAPTGTTGTFTSTATASCAGDVNPANDSEFNQTTVRKGADIQLTKTVSPATVADGGVATYNIQVHNAGPSAAPDLVFHDTLPAGVVFYADNASPSADDDGLWDCSASGQNVTCAYNGSALSSGSDTIFHFRAQAESGVNGDFVNNASVDIVAPVFDPVLDPDPNNNLSQATLTIGPGTDLAITKTVATPVLGGTSTTFTLHAVNNGPRDASNVSITDTLPAGYTVQSIAEPAGWICDFPSPGTFTLTCTKASMAKGEAADIVLTVNVPAVNSVVSDTNTATIAANSPTDAVPANNTATVTFQVRPNKPDLAITKSKSPNPVAVTGIITNTFHVVNNGAADASAPITVVDQLASGESFDNAPTGNPWDCSYDSAAHTVTCVLQDASNQPTGLAAGAAAPDLVITTKAQSAGTLQNVGTVSDGANADYDPSNNTASASVTSSSTNADLQVSKSVDKTHLLTGGNTLTFTVQIYNAGADPATSVQMSDVVPYYTSAAGGTAIAVSSVTGGTNGSCSVSGDTVNCSWDSIDVGQTATVVYTVTRPMKDGVITNSVCAYSTQVGDLDRSNNCADAQPVTVDPIADVEVAQKTVTPNPVLAGTTASYTIQVRNNGPSTAANVTLKDVFSGADFTYLSSSVAGGGSCSYDPGTTTLSCSLGSMSVGQVKTVSVDIRPTHLVPPPGTWTIDNTATVSTTTFDNDHSNDAKSATLNIQNGQVDVTIEKNESPKFVEPIGYDPAGGSNNYIVYQLRVYNYGPSYATHVVMTDHLDTVTPAGSGKSVKFIGDTANSDGTGAGYNWCGAPSPNPFTVNGVADNNEPTITCNVPNALAPGDSVVRYLVFEVLTAPDPLKGDVYYDKSHVSAWETETDLTNNDEDEKTTVRIYSDLSVSKTAPSPVDIYTPFNMTIAVTNGGPGIAPNAQLTDNLPAGMVLTGTPTATSDWGDTDMSCTGSAGNTSFTCTLGNVDYNTTHTPQGETITITVPVMVTDPNTVSYTNTAAVTSDAPEPNPDPHPNSGSATVTMNSPLKLGDTVWYDQNQNGIQDAGEPGLNGVTVTLYNTPDCSGSPYQPVSGFANPVTTGSGSWADGYYEFYPLPQGTYCVEFSNVPLTGYQVSPQNQGSDDTVDSDADTTTMRIENITLSADDLTEDMGVFVQGSLGDRVWCESPTNVNTTFDTGDGDTGLNNVTVNLYADYNCDGAADSATLLATTTTATGGTPNAAGFYQFTGLQVALAGDPNNQTCYVAQVDTTTLPTGCVLPDTPATAQRDVNNTPSMKLDTGTPDTVLADFSFRVADFGDLPDSGSGTFPTTLAENGPYHLLDSALYLGSGADAENDGIPANPDAGVISGGDDGTAGTLTVGSPAGNDDEDGITFVTPFIPGQQACLEVTAHNAKGSAAHLYGWADWNGDGQFQNGERLSGGGFGSGAATIPANTDWTNQQVCFTVPSSATFANGDIHFRFRLTTDTLNAGGYVGRASNGEVEDYWLPMACVGNYIWDDRGSASNNTQGTGDVGLAGVAVRLVWGGTDGTVDTVPSNTGPASGELIWNTTTDANGRYQFCGIAPPSTTGKTYAFQVQVPPVLGYKSVTKDAGGNDQLDSDAGPGNALGTGWAAPAFTVAPDFTTTSSAYMTLNGGAFPTSEAGLEDGNSQSAAGYPDNRTDWTQDFGFLVDRDYGDLPDSGNGAFATTDAENGPWHLITPNLYLGSCVDADDNGQPSARAGVGGSGGDDGNVGFDTVGTCAQPGNDEDGLLSNISPAAPGSKACFKVAAHNATGQDARLYVWIDWNGDGQFQTGEQLTGYDFGTQGYAVIPTGTEPTTPLTECFTMPNAAALAFDGGEVHSRLRLTTEDLSARAGNPPLWAGGAADGEVEDYWSPLACVGNILWQDNGTTADAQDGSDSPLSGVNVRLIWAGADGNVDTLPSDTAAQHDDLILNTKTTDANGIYQFCGLPPGAGTAYQYQVQVPPVPGYYSVTKGAAAADQDSNATPQHSLASGWVADVFGLQVDYTTSPGYILENGSAMPTGEAGNQDSVSAANDHNFPDSRTDWTQDFGFVKYDDYGDLPASYEAGNPAVHPLRPDLYLGGCVDAESANQPGVAANGDDSGAGSYTVGTCASSGDDEDGVTLSTPLVPGAQACVQVTAANATGGSAYLYGWFDWNGNGQFDSGEQLNSGDFASGMLTVPDGGLSGEYCFTVPSSATFAGGKAYYRFRLTTQAALNSPTGPAADGEVEDYMTPLACVGNLIWNDSTGSVQDQQDSGDTGVSGVPVRLVWAGPNGTVDTVPGNATAQNDDRLYTTTTDANGVYGFCGLTGGGNIYQVQLASAPSGLSEAVAANVGDSAHDSNGTPNGSGFVAPSVTITDVTALPTGENGNQDTGSAGYANNFPDNQVDESIDFGFRPTMVDYGDAPDSYGTTGSANGPTHTITPNLYLGSCVDAELDGQPTTNANGDNASTGYYTAGTCATAGNDEDGVQLVTPLVPGAQACVRVDAHNATGSDAYLYGWFDWNGNGNFNDAGEQLNTGDFSSGAVTIPNGGVSGQTYCFTVPAGAAFQGGAAYYRFRLSTANLTAPTGAAPDGEVEDYRQALYCAGNFVWNDGGSATPNVQDGTEPGISGVTLTLHWDGNDNGAFTDAADRTYTTTTDTNGVYAFCGLLSDATGDGHADSYRIDVTPPSGLTAVTPNAGSNEALDSDGDASGVGPVFTLPPNPDNDTAANDANPNGYPDAQTQLAVDFGFAAYDFGDLPAPYHTTLTDNGPRHIILPSNNPTLGSAVDAETDGQPNATATGDDNTGTDDENGVTLPAAFVAGQTYTLTYTVSNASANTVVSAWIDWNGDGDFADTGEQILNNQSITSDGSYTVNVTAPLSVAAQVGVRFRIANETIPGPDGAVGSGEVEDYLVGGQLTYDYGDLPDTFATLDATGGPKHQLNAGLYLGACVDGETNGAPDADAGVLNGGDNGTAGTVTVGTCATAGNDEDGVQLVTPLLPGAQACVQVDAHNATGSDAHLYAWFDWNGDGTFSANEQVSTGDFSGGAAAVPNGGVSGRQYCFTVPADATFDGGEVHMRFRLTTASLAATDWGGTAPDGEVEDYWSPLACVGNYIWNDTGSTTINAQDTNDQPLQGVGVTMAWAGQDGSFGTADDVTVNTTTDAQGRYAFCGLTPGSQVQLSIPTLPAGLNQPVVPDQGSDVSDSDGTQPGGLGTAVILPPLTVPGLSDLAAGNWITGENANEDASTQSDAALTHNYPDGRTNLTLDTGLRSVNSAATKSLTATNQTFTTGTEVAVGEMLTYETTLTLSPGTVNNLTLTDVLDQGLAFVSCDAITTTGTVSATAGTWNHICQNPTVTAEPVGSTAAVDQGRRMVWNFGNVTNGGLTDATITVRYQVVVLDSAANVSGQNLNNQAAWAWDGGSAGDSASDVTILEPELTLSKEAKPTVVLPDEPITFTLHVAHSAKSETNAYDVVLSDPLPDAFKYVDASLTAAGGLTPTSMSYDPATHTIRVTWDTFPLGQTATITFQATMGTSPGEHHTNTALLAWTSLPGDVTTPQSAYNTLSTERYYDPASEVDAYGVRAGAEVMRALPETGFAPHRVTVLPPQRVAYDRLDGITLEIPKLGVSVPIVGVPRNAQGWDLTWLWNQAGWLEGTAFPTWAGNTAITGHVYLPDGEPGPFVHLYDLRWGDRVILHAHGQRYIYAVRSVGLVDPNDTSVLGHKNRDWVTLITCKDYDETLGDYRYRVIVQAVLMKVEPEP